MKKKFFTSLTGTMAALMLVLGSAGMTAEAAEEQRFVDQSARRFSTCDCGTRFSESIERDKFVGMVEVGRCRDLHHDLDCYIYTFNYADLHTFYCPKCGTVDRVERKNERSVENIHLTKG